MKTKNMNKQQYDFLIDLAENGTINNNCTIHKQYIPMINRIYKQMPYLLTDNMENDIKQANAFLWSLWQKDEQYNKLHGNNTIRAYCSALRWVYSNIYGLNFNNKRLFMPQPRPSETMALTEQEEELVWNATNLYVNDAKTEWVRQRRTYLRNLLTLIWLNGKRLRECGNIDFANIEAKREGNGCVSFLIMAEKSKKKIQVVLPLELYEILKSDNFKYSNHNSKSQCLYSFTQGIKRFIKDNFNKSIEVRPHVFRHTFVARGLRKGYNTTQLCHITGQQEKTMREHYIHTCPDLVINTIRNINNIGQSAPNKPQFIYKTN